MSVVKYADITVDLDRRVRKGEFHGKLPSTRDLAREYGVSKQTVTTALKPHLRTELLTSERRGGMVIHPEKLRTGTIAVVGWYSEKKLMEYMPCDHLFDRIVADGFSYVFLAFRDTRIPASQLHLFSSFDAVFFACSSFCQQRIAEQLERDGIPFVSCGFCPTYLNLNYVEFDSLRTLRELTEKLVDAGYRRIGLCFPSNRNGYNDMIRRKWKQIKKELSLPEVDGDFFPYRWFVTQEENMIEYTRRMAKRFSWPEVVIYWHPIRPGLYARMKNDLDGIPESTLLISREIPLADPYLPERFLLFEYPDHSEYFFAAWEILRKRLFTPEIPSEQVWLRQKLVLHRNIPACSAAGVQESGVRKQ
ncbi:MAG: Bacterial regulatory proteins, gntR family [Lentisphaerae bacterium ADurb.Bin242]|nr:MAG: Bacterial regulatory proteins, gntR family [Lentisphaerae bacterium ADurb.Bin242]